ncbi:zinc finger protein 717-like, partial [Cebus imitator]|uniref:zinc finger protein 717-like n=1 Tax=Cebus imitator TaxID=2715852 RepID=UPI000809AA3C
TLTFLFLWTWADDLRRNVLLQGLVSFEEVAVHFTWEEWQDLDDAQRTLYREVLLETYSILVSLGHCVTKPEVIFKLEQGAEPWLGEEWANQGLSDVQMVDIIERSQEIHHRHMWQVAITNNKTSTEETVELGITLNLSSNHIPSVMVNNASYSGMRPEELNISQKISLSVEPHEMQAEGKPHDRSITGKSLTHGEYLSHHNKIHMRQQLFEYGGQGKAFSTEAEKSPVGEMACTYNEYEKSCDKSALTSQKITAECNVCGKMFHKKSKLTKHQKIHTGEKPCKCIQCEKSFIKKSYLANHQRTHM